MPSVRGVIRDILGRTSGESMRSAGAVVLAIIFAVVAILNAVLLTTFHQWGQ